MDEAFAVHMFTEAGKDKARLIAEDFDACLTKIQNLVGSSGPREMAIAKTKLEEACFFAKKAMAKGNCV